MTKKYWKSTPIKYRKLGDALMAASTTLATYSVADDWEKWITITIILTGTLGKFLTNFFGPDETMDKG